MKKKNENILKVFSKISLHYLVLTFLIIVMAISMSMHSRYFLTITNIEVMVNTFIMEAIMALGMTMVIISGGTDISVSGVLPFTAIIFAKLMLQNVPIIVAMLVALAASGVIGLINNELRRILKIHPMVVTMAVQLTLRGLNLAITNGSVISGFSAGFQKISEFRLFGLSVPILVYIILAVVFYVFSKNHKSFLSVYFVGGNKEASAFSGMNTECVLRWVFIINALLAGLAGILSTTVYNSASYSFGQNAEMRVITAVAIGGTSLTHGGNGSIAGTLLGTLFMALIYNSFVMSGISTYYQDVFTGAMLIIAVLLSEGTRIVKEKSFKQALGDS